MKSFTDKIDGGFSVRPFCDDDYPQLVEIGNRVWPDFPSTIEEMRFRDCKFDPKIKWGRLVAVVDGRVVATASYGQRLSMYHPNKFEVNLDVDPEFEGRGIGSALYDALITALEPHEATVLRTEMREDRTRGIDFLRNRGFVAGMREWESRLDVRNFRPEAFAEKVAPALDAGFVIKSLAELSIDPNWDRKLYEMNWQVALDIPHTDTLTKPTFEQFMNRLIGNPGFLPEGWFIAIDGDDYVGESALWKSQAEDGLHVGTTGVLREYRRRGIAFALKVRAIEFAKSIGCPEVKTWNEQNNVGMLAINNALGFVRQPAWINFTKTIGAF